MLTGPPGRAEAGAAVPHAAGEAGGVGLYAVGEHLEAVGADWDEMKAAAAPKPVDPRRNEVLLRPRHVLEAVRKIGPAAAQEFYRTRAGERDREGRQEAAERLAECTDADRKKIGTPSPKSR